MFLIKNRGKKIKKLKFFSQISWKKICPLEQFKNRKSVLFLFLFLFLFQVGTWNRNRTVRLFHVLRTEQEQNRLKKVGTGKHWLEVMIFKI
jgi:hypothetical protein